MQGILPAARRDREIECEKWNASAEIHNDTCATNYFYWHCMMHDIGASGWINNFGIITNDSNHRHTQQFYDCRLCWPFSNIYHACFGYRKPTNRQTHKQTEKALKIMNHKIIMAIVQIVNYFCNFSRALMFFLLFSLSSPAETNCALCIDIRGNMCNQRANKQCEQWNCVRRWTAVCEWSVSRQYCRGVDNPVKIETRCSDHINSWRKQWKSSAVIAN